MSNVVCALFFFFFAKCSLSNTLYTSVLAGSANGIDADSASPLYELLVSSR